MQLRSTNGHECQQSLRQSLNHCQNEVHEVHGHRRVQAMPCCMPHLKAVKQGLPLGDVQSAKRGAQLAMGIPLHLHQQLEI